MKNNVTPTPGVASELSVEAFKTSESGRWRFRKCFEFGSTTHRRCSFDHALDRLVEVKFQEKDVPMFKTLICIFLLATSAVAMASQRSCKAGVQINASADETKIRSARDELNTALERKDLAVTGKYWLPDAHTTGGGGSLWVGRDKNIEGFSKIFSDPNFVSGCRTPDHVEVAVGGPNEAAETGVWEWRSRYKDQILTYRGRYLVMWQKLNGQWLIRSELYATTGCSGGTSCR